jgi:DNA-binding transcriptional MocR family regulator
VDPDAFSWESVLPGPERPDDLWQYWLRDAGTKDAIRFTGATADPAHFPTAEFRTVVNEVLESSGARALDYGPAAGFLPLREWLADRLARRGIDADPERLLIVNGSQQGLDLIARLLVREGDRVLVEEPSYSNGFRLLQTHGAEVDTVRFDAGGLDIESLERACRKRPARLLYTMPLFQNPTGMVLEEDRIEPILEICRRHRLPIVEDHFDAELVYQGEPPVPIAARDRSGQVILIGTFSKILFPGLRLGWMVVPRPLLRMIQELKEMTDISTGLLAQQAMDLYCRRGLLDAHLVRVRKINGRRLHTLLESMEQEFPAEVAWTRPRGGMTVWVQLPPGVDSLALLETVRRHGVEFSPGPFFFPNGGGSGFLRLCCVRETEERIRRGIHLLGEAIREHAARAPGRSTARPFL